MPVIFHVQPVYFIVGFARREFWIVGENPKPTVLYVAANNSHPLVIEGDNSDIGVLVVTEFTRRYPITKTEPAWFQNDQIAGE